MEHARRVLTLHHPLLAVAKHLERVPIAGSVLEHAADFRYPLRRAFEIEPIAQQDFLAIRACTDGRKETERLAGAFADDVSALCVVKVSINTEQFPAVDADGFGEAIAV